MPIVPLTTANLSAIAKRIEALRPDTPRRWGSLEPAGMLLHLSLTAELSLGEITLEDKSTRVSRILGRIAYHRWLPWPKGRIKVPADWTPATKNTLDKERARLLESLKRFVAAAEREPERKTIHPMFGPFTLQFWQHVHGKHINHHCEQFGL